MPLPNQDTLARLSRDRYFLIKTGIVSVAISMLIAIGVSALTNGGVGTEEKVKKAILDAAEQPLSEDLLLQKIRSGFSAPAFETDIATSLQESLEDMIQSGMLGATSSAAEIDTLIRSASFLHDADKELFRLLNLGLRRGKVDEAVAGIDETDKGHRKREEFLGDLYRKSEQYEDAIAAYLREAEEYPEARYSRRNAVQLLRQERDFTRLKLVLAEPGYEEVFSDHELMYLYADSKNFGKLFTATLRSDLKNLTSLFVIPALYAAAIWFLILLSFTRGQARTITFMGLGFLAGILSACLTLYLVLLQERVQRFDYESQVTPLGRAIYFVAGVGLREELAKLVCFIPLAFLLKKQNNNLVALVVAGTVGLGFAFQENLLYYQQSLGQVSYTPWSRLLTANAIHIAMTGVIGFYFFRMVVRRGHGWEDFLLNFLMMVVAHGMYDAVLTLPSFETYSMLSIVIIALIVYRYLDPLKANIDIHRLHRRLSPLGIFVIGSILLVCGTLVFSAAGSPFRFAFGAFATAVGGMVPTAFVFINRFRDI